MNNNIKVEFPNSEKIYLRGELFPQIRVGMRRIKLTPTVRIENGNKVFALYSFLLSGNVKLTAVAFSLCKYSSS